MVQLNPVPVFGTKKYQYYLLEIFHRNFHTNGKRSIYRARAIVDLCEAILNNYGVKCSYGGECSRVYWLMRMRSSQK